MMCIGMQIAKYKVEGLTCEGCTCGHCGQPALIFLRCLDGISSVNPDFENDTVLIEFDSNDLSKDEIISKAFKRGFVMYLVK